MTHRVVEDWRATYADPIRLAAGEVLHLTGRQENWDGHIWRWARSAAGPEGWIPDSLVARGPTGPVAREDYRAAELTCLAGDILTVEKVTHGWAYCRSKDGASGWVPERNLAPLMTGNADRPEA